MVTTRYCIIPILIIYSTNTSIGQATSTDLDSFVNEAIALSEKALFDARLYESRQIVDLSYFKEFRDFSAEHEILLTVQKLRIDGFINILYKTGSNRQENFDMLSRLFTSATQLPDNRTKAAFYRSFSSAQGSLGNRDSAEYYESRAMELYQEVGDKAALAEIRASHISRIHNRLSAQNKKSEVVALIPQYEEEIEYAAKYSKYALAYNTRHLAQIHRTETFNYDEALRLFKISLLLREEMAFLPFLPASYSSLGDVYAKTENVEESIEMYQKAADLADEIGFIRYRIHPRVSMAELYADRNEIDKALEYLATALKIAAATQSQREMDQIIAKIAAIGEQ